MSLRNLITDVAGVLIGNAHDERLASGVTAIVFEEPAVASVDVRGGAPGTRETDLLEPHRTVERIDAVVLSGGSAFGLDAGAGVQAYLREQGRGFAIGTIRVPLVCGAVLFDLLNGGDKNWGRFPPYRELGYAAASASGGTFALGTAGAGFGATTVNRKGGLGSASAVTRRGHTVGALVAVNACGSVIVGNGPHFWAGPFEEKGEFGGYGFPPSLPPAALVPTVKGGVGENTTIALVATDAALSKAQAKEFAVMAQDGLASIPPIRRSTGIPYLRPPQVGARFRSGGMTSRNWVFLPRTCSPGQSPVRFSRPRPSRVGRRVGMIATVSQF
jgi:D-aminopeptidase